MASHSPQRARRPPAHPITQGSMHGLRETSRSPSLRSRTLKAQSMPIVPTAMQIFAASNATQPSSQGQASPTSSINSRRSPPTGVQVQRLLPTPPHPNPPNLDPGSERHMSPPLPTQHSHNPPNPHYPRPINRGPPPQFVTKYQNMDQESWQMTEELLAEIERADLQQSQAQTNPAHSYPAGYSRGQTNSPPKDPAVERIRATERSSPKEPDNNQQKRQHGPRESPKARDRPPTSPTTGSFAHAPSQTPEPQAPPSYQSPHASPGEHQPSGYVQYTRDSPPVIRRTTNATSSDGRQPISLATQTPPLQAISARTPDRSLPVQEEAEDDLRTASKNGTRTHEIWRAAGDDGQHHHTGSSPTPSSDLNPEAAYQDDPAHGGRTSRSGLRDDDGAAIDQQNSLQNLYPDGSREHGEDEDGYTPRSPTADLPDHPPVNYYSQQTSNSRVPQTLRGRTRNGSTDQLGLRTFDPAVFENDKGMLPMGSDQSPQYVDQRRPAQNQSQQFHDSRTYANQPQHRQAQMPPDDIQQYDSSAYIQAYYQSPRPDAPIPPTPHSQTAAPSPSPLVSGGYDGGGKELPPFSPVAPVGSPYPYPFSHVRRNQSYSGQPSRPQPPQTFDANDLSAIQQQLAKQWQIYAQNQNYSGNISDSTFSPSATPFQGNAYNNWAFLHTNRTLGRMHDTTSLRSSPSHEPIALPTPPPMIGVKKKVVNRPSSLRRLSNRKPPPRVESTQPRETSPEPSSSGEETAGEERFAVAEEGNWVNGAVPVITAEDGNGEWIDEEDDEEDLLELEYHPAYISNIEKRRRRWEIGWEAVTQALQALDRQTDATMVLLAAPSHSTKLYAATSRSVRRQSVASNAVALREIRTAFSGIASHRRGSRSHKASLLDRFLLPSNTSGGDGSDGSSESREEDLKRALEAALGSLGALGGIYEQREARWHEEMRRISEDRERVEMLLRQVLGDGHVSAISNASVVHSP
ncbi:hypothetical protein Hypma_012565 [Hypsizygus marmoreus]|uniref:Uncharacterized protein n=1 Tax=Hypsizygus marmoreus TaxID=39966 RepID=A0A369JNA9_HYPMA|nr:hypothetical protein Hypma_012565 [Hypsizygus marmoreus]